MLYPVELRMHFKHFSGLWRAGQNAGERFLEFFNRRWIEFGFNSAYLNDKACKDRALVGWPGAIGCGQIGNGCTVIGLANRN